MLVKSRSEAGNRAESLFVSDLAPLKVRDGLPVTSPCSL